MPSKSEKQHAFMRIAGHDKTFADKVGIPQETAQEFYDADKKQGLYQKPGKAKKKKPLQTLTKQKLRE